MRSSSSFLCVSLGYDSVALSVTVPLYRLALSVMSSRFVSLWMLCGLDSISDRRTCLLYCMTLVNWPVCIFELVVVVLEGPNISDDRAEANRITVGICCHRSEFLPTKLATCHNAVN